jgi:TonB family protein
MNANQTPQDPKANRPGAMTMAMQAVQVKATGPKVLRIGLIQGGKIIEERIIRKRESVTVGSSEKNHFVVHSEGVPARFELFQLVGDAYILNFTDSMRGRVGLPGGVHDLDQMRSSGTARNAGNYWQVKLSDKSRGKVNIGTTTLLFQFVIPPPVQPRPQLPAAVRGGLVGNIDWVFTAFVVFTFMSMFSFLVYLENADWPIDTGLAAVPEDFAKFIFEEPPPPEEVVETETVAEGEGEGEAEEESKGKTTGKSRGGGEGMSADERARMVADKSARIAAEASQAAEALIVGALSSEAGGALADVLAGGAVIGNAEEIMAQASGVGVAKKGGGGTLRERSGGGSGSGQKGLGSLAVAKGSAKSISEGGAVKERTIKGKANVGSGGDIGGTGDFDSSVVVRTIKTRLSAIRACYERELRRNPTLEGKVTIQFSIQPRGNVTNISITANTTGDSAVAKCVSDAIGRFRFNPGPEGGSVTYSYPFVFAPQN